MSEIQKAKSKTRLVTFDFDLDNADDKISIIHIVSKEVSKTLGFGEYDIIETRGGFHLIAHVDRISSHKDKWYNTIKEIHTHYSKDRDNIGDIMLPVPGTYQGGFTPRFIAL